MVSVLKIELNLIQPRSEISKQQCPGINISTSLTPHCLASIAEVLVSQARGRHLAVPRGDAPPDHAHGTDCINTYFHCTSGSVLSTPSNDISVTRSHYFWGFGSVKIYLIRNYNTHTYTCIHSHTYVMHKYYARIKVQKGI